MNKIRKDNNYILTIEILMFNLLKEKLKNK